MSSTGSEYFLYKLSWIEHDCVKGWVCTNHEAVGGLFFLLSDLFVPILLIFQAVFCGPCNSLLLLLCLLVVVYLVSHVWLFYLRSFALNHKWWVTLNISLEYQEFSGVGMGHMKLALKLTECESRISLKTLLLPWTHGTELRSLPSLLLTHIPVPLISAWERAENLTTNATVTGCGWCTITLNLPCFMWWTFSFIHQSVIAFTDFWLRVGCFYFHKSRVKEFRQVLEAEICAISLHWPDCSTQCENSVMSIILAESGPSGLFHSDVLQGYTGAGVYPIWEEQKWLMMGKAQKMCKWGGFFFVIVVFLVWFAF